jgi:type IV pilus assembly protein PilM
MLAGDVCQGDEIKSELILFGADSESIRSHIELLKEIGLKPVGIDVLPCALFRSFERSLQRQEDSERTAVFVDLGGRFTTVVFGRGREINFVKQLPIGGDTLNHEIAAKLGVKLEEAETLRRKLRMEKSGGARTDLPPGDDSPRQNGPEGAQPENLKENLDASTRQAMIDAIGAVGERLAREISLCFRYYTVTFRGKRVERAVFSGGEAHESILLNVLRRQLAVEIEVAQPLRGFDMMDLSFDSDRRGMLCEWAVAVGLGLKGLDGSLAQERTNDAESAVHKAVGYERNRFSSRLV